MPVPVPVPPAPPAAAAPAPVQAPLAYTLSVTPEDLQNIGAVLQDLPKRIADPLITKLNAQINEQQKPKK